MKSKRIQASKEVPLEGWIAFIILLAVYSISFWVVEPFLGTRTLILVLIPVVGASWHIGALGGILSSTLTLLASALLFELKGYSNAWMILIDERLIGSISLYFVAVFIGYVGDVQRRHLDKIKISEEKAQRFEARVASLRNLVNITNEVLDAEDFPAVLYTLAQETRKGFGADDCLISLWDSPSKSYYSRVAAGKEKRALERIPSMPEDTELSMLQNADVLRYGKLEELAPTWRNFMTIHPQGSLLALPLGADGEKIGILQLLYEYKHDFKPDELSYAKLTSRQISQAIWKLILLNHAEDQVEELGVLHEVSLVLTSAEDEYDLLEKTVEILGKTLYSQNLTIVLLDKERKVLERKATYQLSVHDIHDLIPLGKGITGRVAQTGILERYDDVRKAPGYIAALSSTRSEICVPIKVWQDILGVINIESSRYAAFDTRDERILTTVANQIGVALTRLRSEKAREARVAEIHRSKELVEVLTEVASQMEMSSDPDAVMHQLGTALDQKGLKVLIALAESDTANLMVAYTSLDADLIRRLEIYAKTSIENFRISADNLPKEVDVESNLRPVIFDDYISVIVKILHGSPNKTLERILKRTFDIENMKLGHFPLVYREKVLGFLWLWGKHFLQDDLPTLAVFAKQVAATFENARLFADVQRLAVTDGLTKLYTRRHFFEMAYEEYYRARRYGHALSVIMLDLDHFKKVNDTYGHAAGDIVLESAAAVCRQTLRANDLIGRYGGEEIVILLVEAKLDVAVQVAQRIRRNIRALNISTKKGEIQITVSGGVAGDNVENMNLIDMIETADKALYQAKENGRDRIEIAPRYAAKESD